MSVDDRHSQEVAPLQSIKVGGRLAGLHFTLDPGDRPVLLKDTGSQGIYAIPLQTPH